MLNTLSKLEKSILKQQLCDARIAISGLDVLIKSLGSTHAKETILMRPGFHRSSLESFPVPYLSILQIGFHICFVTAAMEMKEGDLYFGRVDSIFYFFD